jgi:hypothetical protein
MALPIPPPPPVTIATWSVSNIFGWFKRKLARSLGAKVFCRGLRTFAACTSLIAAAALVHTPPAGFHRFG